MIQVGSPASGAVFDNYGKHRYSLWRVWDSTIPQIGWVLLNPSIADELILDPTLKRCKKYSELWGYGGFCVANVFGLISTNPKNLFKVKDPVGQSDRFIYELFDYMDLVVLGWGNLVLRFPERMEELRHIIGDKKTHVLKITGQGQPSHPLYLKGDLKPYEYNVFKDNEEDVDEFEDNEDD